MMIRMCCVAIANPKVAEWADMQINNGLKEPPHTISPRRSVVGRLGFQYLKGTYAAHTVYCESWDHPLCNTEFMFPFASVVEVPQDEVLDTIGGTLVVSAVRMTRFTAELRLPQYPASEPWCCTDLRCTVGPTARGQPVRVPLPTPCNPSGKGGA